VRIDRAYAVAAAAARDFNNELTVILSSVSESLANLDDDDPARVLLLDLQGAAQRCVWKAESLLQFSTGRGARPSAASLEVLIDE
jgi:signal transduction histidine kinase